MKTNEPEVLSIYVKPPQAQATRDNLVTYLTRGTHPTLNDADMISINGQPHGKARIQFNLVTTGDFDEITRILNGDEPETLSRQP